MTVTKGRAPISAANASPRTKPSNYPEPFFSRMARREKRPLGDVFGLKNFGVNLTTLLPGGESALLHRHSKQDEFVYILVGTPTLVTDEGETALAPGMCIGFPAVGHGPSTRQPDIVQRDLPGGWRSHGRRRSELSVGRDRR